MSATGVEALRSRYVTARRDLARADADVSQATTLLSELDAAHAAARRGEPTESARSALEDLHTEIASWAYDTESIPEPDRPAFADFEVESLDDLRERLVQFATAADDGDTDRFATLRSLLRTAVNAVEPELSEPSLLLEALEDAVEAGAPERAADIAERFVDALAERGATVEDLRRLVERGRGPTAREHLDRLQTDTGRDDALEAIADALDDPEETDYGAARAPVAGAVRAIDSFAAARRAEIADVTDELTDEYPSDPAAPLDGMANETPVLLLPTRLETRFEDVSDPNGPDVRLKVRVYPDDVHVDTHERELTDEEVRWGVHFWQQVWWASHTGSAEEVCAAVPDEIVADVDLSTFPEDAAARHGAVLERAWNQLAERFGPDRAAWVKRELAPEEADALLDGPLDPVPDVDFEAIRADADRRPDSWTRPPRARGLPDQWVAFAETDGSTVTARSGPVRRPLAIGPDPDRIGSLDGESDGAGDGSGSNAPGDTDADALGGGETSWVFDFDEALDAGMALTVPLTADQASAGVDSLVVLGVSTALDERDGRDAVETLLESHRYTDGLSILERGTPTNDTREDGAGTAPGDRPTPFDLACGDARKTPDADSDAARAAALLGLDGSRGAGGSVLGRVAGGGASHDAAAEAMNAALWPATLGYYLPHMLAPAYWTDSVRPRPEFLRWLESYRRHFVEYVRAGGPLPTLRVGDQPYGVLPTTDLNAWRPVGKYAVSAGADRPKTAGHFTYERLADRDAESDLVSRLRSMRGAWADATSDVPSIESPDDPETVVTELLAMAGVGYGYHLRDLIGEDVMTDLVGSRTSVGDDVDDAKAAVTAALRKHVSNAETPRVGGLLASDPATEVHAALVADDLDDYLRSLRTEPHGALRSGPPGAGLSLADAGNLLVWLITVLFDGDDRSLLEVLLYVALMQEYRLGRVRLGHQYDDFWEVEEFEDVTWADTVWSLFPEPETYDDDDLTLWAALDESVADDLAEHPNVDGKTSYGDALRRNPDIDAPFAAVVEAFDALESVDEDLAERLLRETLDLSSHRFDAWATSVATRRLDGMRESAGDGLYVGAYGYVEDLEREFDSRSAGYVQAPSVGQATTAAVLRSGFETKESDALAVDLSAERVRDARELIGAVRDGRPLGELLGYRFERRLREEYPALDVERYLPALRAVAPLVEGKVDRDGMSESDDAAERDVVDGVAIVDEWRTGDPLWGRSAGSHGTTLPSTDPDDDSYDAYVAIRTELESLEASLDAVSDVLTAESVHQLVSGNPERAGGSLDALSRGEAPPDLSVTETPRTGTACTHRLLALLDPDADGSAWGSPSAPRADAEPALDDWAGTLLGDPSRVVCRVAFEPRPTAVAGGSGDDSDGDEAGETTVGTPEWRVTTLRLADLDLCPLDLVYLVEGDAEAWHSELEERIDYRTRRERSDVAPEGDVRISFAPPAEWPDPAALGVDPDDAIGFGPLLEAVRGVREVVTSGRAADARDVSLPGEAGDRGRLKAPLVDRVETVEPGLESAVAAMDDVSAAFAADDGTTDGSTGDSTENAEGESNMSSEYGRLADLTTALAGVSSGPMDAVDRRLDAVDPGAVGTDLATLVAVAAGDAVALARDESGDVVVDPREPVLVGLSVARPDTEVQIDVTAGGRTRQAEARVGRDGVFEAKLPEEARDALSSGDTFDLDVTVDGTTTNVTARYDEVEGERSFAGPALAEAAALGRALDSLETSATAVTDAVDALDADVIRTAADHVTVEQWPEADASGQLDAALDAGTATLPGFADPDGWDELGPMLLAVADGRLSRELLLETETREYPRDPTELAELVDDLAADAADGLDTFGAAVDAATSEPAVAFATGGCEALRAALLVAADHGIHGSVPVSATGATTDDIVDLTRQADSVAAECAERLSDAAAAADDAAGQRDRLEALFGDAFEVLPPFAASNPGELDRALDPSHDATLLGPDPLAAETWFQRVSRVRDVPRDFGRALTYGESLGDRSPADGSRFRVAQLPYEDPDTWVGRPAAWDGDPPTGKLSLVAHVQGDQTADELVGLFVDEFVETVPGDTETTGVSVHYDKPGNRAPQSMLLAVPPTDDDWSLKTLADLVTESVDLAKLRTVDRDALSGLGHLLPATALATNESTGVGPDTASVDADDLGPPWWYRDGQGGGN
ncbi:hypothetical protein [Halosimplex salinum]|uniref:hypothetical protein n=1 Tax=Halosimplex salinum TaxID=1710538 RepID=UPI000F460844|nr:hypothetical protein [Halosimplex salinum]